LYETPTFILGSSTGETTATASGDSLVERDEWKTVHNKKKQLFLSLFPLFRSFALA